MGNFKKEKDHYMIEINSKDEFPMFISLYKKFSYSDKYSSDVLKMASSELNFYKGIKILCFKSSFRIQAEMYIVSSEAFKYVFHKIMTQISYAENDILKECENVLGKSGGQIPSVVSERIPFLITSMDIGNVKGDGTIIQDYGSTIYDYKTQYLKPRISIQPIKTSGTYTVYVKLYKNGVLSPGTSSPSGYSYSNSLTNPGLQRLLNIFPVGGRKNPVIGLPGNIDLKFGTVVFV